MSNVLPTTGTAGHAGARSSAAWRNHPDTLLAFWLLMLGGIELSNVLRQSIGHGPADALHAGLFVSSLFGFVCLLAGLIGAGRMRIVTLTGLYLFLASSVVTLLVSWLAFWITGSAVNFDALGILAGSPLAAALHLLSSDPLMLILLIAGLLLCLYATFRLLRLASRPVPGVPRSTRALLCALAAVLAVYSGMSISRTDGSRSSYAPFLGSMRPQPQPAAVTVYSCPRSREVPISMPPRDAGNGVPIIVVMIESLRADLLTRFADAIPNLAQLASEALVFERAYATASHSDYEDLAFWYSRYPLRADHRLGYPRDADWRGLSVFEYFKLQGYSTAYFSSQNEKWGEMINWLAIPGVDTYFDSERFEGDTWENPDDAAGLISLIRAGYARSGKVADAHTLDFAADWIERHAREPFFIGLNLQNTHYHYFIPEGGERPFLPDELGFRAVYSAWPREQAGNVRNRYLNAAYNVDAAFAEFAARLKRAGVWDKAVVLVVGDSGEAFYEHGFGNHSGPMYEEVARTLAILKLPRGDVRNGTSWGAPVSHVDFVPALLDLAGLPEWAGFQGRAPWQHSGNVPVYMTVNALTVEDAVVRWPWKLMKRTFPKNEMELYNLETDPDETQNQLDARPGIARELLQDVQSWRQCQIGYYADRQAHVRIQPPRFHDVDAPDVMGVGR